MLLQSWPCLQKPMLILHLQELMLCHHLHWHGLSGWSVQWIAWEKLEGEKNMIVLFIWKGQHAGCQHWEKVAKIVYLLFMDHWIPQTIPSPELVHVKKIVFNLFQCGWLGQWAPIIEQEHPAIKVLLSLPKGAPLIYALQQVFIWWLWSSTVAQATLIHWCSSRLQIPDSRWNYCCYWSKSAHSNSYKQPPGHWGQIFPLQG